VSASNDVHGTIRKGEGMSADEWLRNDGWREWPNQFKKYARCYYKRFDTPFRCHGNEDKPGMQVQLAVSISDFNGDCREHFEIEIVGGLSDETWVTLHNYSLPTDIAKAVALIPRLVSLWEAANGAKA
jgi:hypothetical protein